MVVAQQKSRVETKMKNYGEVDFANHKSDSESEMRSGVES